MIGISNLKKEDVVQNFFVAKTHQHVLFFTNKGRAYRLRGYEIPDTTRQARGTALVNLLTLPPGEEVSRAVFPIDNFERRRVSRDGHASTASSRRRSSTSSPTCAATGSSRSTSTRATNCSRSTSPTASHDIILASSTQGMAVHFNEKRRAPDGAPGARRASAMTLAPGDTIVAMDVVDDDRREVLLVTSQAFGKRTPIDEYRHTSRGGKGVKAFAQGDDIGHVVDQILVAADDEVLMITSGNQVIRIKVCRDPQDRPLDEGRSPAASGRGRRGHRDHEPREAGEADHRDYRRTHATRTVEACHPERSPCHPERSRTRATRRSRRGGAVEGSSKPPLVGTSLRAWRI